MICPNCKKEIKDTVKFCGYCGCKIPLPEEKPKEEIEPVSEKNTESIEKRHRPKVWLIIGLILVIACIGAFFAWQYLSWPRDTEQVIRDSLTELSGIDENDPESLDSIILSKLEFEETDRSIQSRQLILTVVIRNSDVAPVLDEIAESTDIISQSGFLETFKEKFGAADTYEESATVIISKGSDGEYQVSFDEYTYDLFMGKLLTYYRDHLAG